MTDRRTLHRRIATGWALPALAVAALVAVPALLADRLPAQVFETDRAAGIREWPAYLTGPVLWIVGMAVFATVAQVVSRPHAVQGRVWVAVQWGFATSLVARPLATVARDLDLAGPPLHPQPWWSAAWAVTVAAFVAAALGWVAAGPEAPGGPAIGRPAADAPRMPLADGERLLWSRAVVSRRGIAVSAVWLVATVLIALGHASDGPPVEVFAFLLAAVVVGLQSWARVRVDGTGVHVTQPLVRRELVGAGIAEIVQATRTDLRPDEVSWSAYGVVQQPGRTLYRAARSGEMLALTLSGGRRLGITVPDAATAAALLNSELDRRRAPTC